MAHTTRNPIALHGVPSPLESPPELPATIYGYVNFTCTANGTEIPSPAGVTLYFYDEGGELLVTAVTGNETSSNNSYIARIEGYSGTVQVYVGSIFIQNISISSGSIVRLDILVNDTTRPTAPSNMSAVVNGRNVTIAWDASLDNVMVKEYLYEVFLNGTLYTNGSVNKTWFTLTSLPDGLYRVNITAVDPACNTNTSTLEFAVDTRSPRLSIITPREGEVLNVTNITIHAIAIDSITGISNAVVMVDGVTVNHSLTQINDTAWSITANTILSEGQHNVTITVYDGESNANTARANFTVDTGPPIIELLEGPQERWVNWSPITYKFNVSDAGTGVNWSTLQVTASNATILNVTVTLSDPEGKAGIVEVVLEPGAGNFSLTIEVLDGIWLRASLAVHAGYDPYPPLVSVQSPSPGESLNTSTVVIEVVAEDNLSGIIPGSINAWIDGYGNITLEYDPENGTFTGQVTLSDGAYTLHVSIRDRAWNEGGTSADFIVDTGAPQLSIEGLSNGEYTNRTTITVSVTATDPQGIQRIAAFLDGEPVAECNCTGNNTEHLTFDLEGLSDGTHTLRIEAEDTAGNPSLVEILFTVDTIPPEVVLDYPRDGAYYNTSTVTLNATVSDTLVSLARVYLDGELVYEEEPGSETLSIVVPLELDEGWHNVTIVAVDAAGNHASATALFCVDTTPPQIVSVTPGEGEFVNRTSITVMVQVEEENMLLVELELDGQAIDYNVERDGSTWTVTSDVTVEEGAHTLLIRLADAAGNTVTESITFTVDLTPPVVVVQSPEDGSWLGESDVVLSLALHDNNALSNVEVRVDGVLYYAGDVEGEDAYLEVVLSDLEDGSHTIGVVVWDAAGNLGESEISIRVDTVPPVVEIASPGEGESYNTTTIMVEIYIVEANNVTVEASIDGGALALSLERIDDSTWRAYAEASIGEGAHTLSVTVEDPAGNTGTASRSFTIDLTPPSVTIESPQEGSWLPSGTLTINASVSDNLGLERAVVIVDGEAVHEQYLSGTDGSINVEVSGLDDGAHSINIIVWDSAGNMNEAVVTINIDTIPPTIEYLYPLPGAALNDTSVLIEARILEANNVTVVLQVDGETVDPQVELVEDGVWHLAYQASLSEGTHTVELQVYDPAGNSAGAVASFIVDLTPPTIVIESPGNGSVLASPIVDFAAYASDTLSGVNWSSLNVSVDGEPVEVSYDPETGYIGATIELPEGEHELTVEVRDNAGNLATASVVFRVDLGSPVIELNPKDSIVINTTSITVEVNVTDDNGLETVRFILNGEIIGECACNGTTSYQTMVTLEQLAEGSNIFRVEAIDVGGKKSNATLVITVDLQPPTVTISYPLPGLVTNESTILLIASVTDNTGLEHVEVLLNGEPVDYELSDNGTLTAILTLDENVNSISIVAVDLAGNSNSVETTVILDTTKPVINVSGDLPDVTNETSVSFTVFVSDNIRVDKLIITSNVGSETVYINGSSAYVNVTVNLTLGSNTIILTAVDSAGNSESLTLEILMDNVPPVIIIEDMPPLTNSSTVIIKAMIIDNISGIANITVLVDGQPADYTFDGTNLTVTLNLADGSHEITIRAWDAAGNTEERSIMLLVDTTPPQLSVDLPTYTNTTQTTVVLTASDNTSGITLLQVLVDGELVWEKEYQGAEQVNESIIVALTEGPHNITITARDAAGNTIEAGSVLIVDTTPPTITLVYPIDGAIIAESTTLMNATIVDLYLDEQSITVLLDGEPVQHAVERQDGAITVTAMLESLEPGMHTLEIRASDKAGNTVSAWATFYVDLEAPAIDVADLLYIDSVGAVITVNFSDDLLADIGAWAYNVTVDGDAVVIGIGSDGSIQLKVIRVNNYYYTNITLTILDPAGRTTSKVFYIALGQPASTSVALQAGKPTLVPIPFNTIPDLLSKELETCNATMLRVTPSWSLQELIDGLPMVAAVSSEADCELRIMGFLPPGTPQVILYTENNTGIVIVRNTVEVTSLFANGTIYEYNTSTGMWQATLVRNGILIGPTSILEPGRVYLLYAPGSATQAVGPASSMPLTEQFPGTRSQEENRGLQGEDGNSTRAHRAITGLAAAPTILGGLLISRKRRRLAALQFVIVLMLLSLTHPLQASSPSAVTFLSTPQELILLDRPIANLSVSAEVGESRQTILTIELDAHSPLEIMSITVTMNSVPQNASYEKLNSTSALLVIENLDPPTGNLEITVTVKLPEEGGNGTLDWRITITTIRGLTPDLPAEANGTITLSYTPPQPPPEETTQPPTNTTTQQPPENQTTPPPTTTQQPPTQPQPGNETTPQTETTPNQTTTTEARDRLGKFVIPVIIIIIVSIVIVMFRLKYSE